jgi:dihydroxyacetone kinase-like predicted kinase
MREQHRLAAGNDASIRSNDGNSRSEFVQNVKPYGFVAVSVGEGLQQIFESLGADLVVSGGQTMNPSAEEIRSAIDSVNASTVYVFPNNSNIILAAEQAAGMMLDKQVIVVPTRSVPQGFAAMMAFQQEAETGANTSMMQEAIARLASGGITRATRAAEIDDVCIAEDDYIGILDTKIVIAAHSADEALLQLLDRMISDGSEVVSIYYGEQVEKKEAEEAAAKAAERYPDAEIELYPGGQPLYPYLCSAEQ